MDLTKAQAQVSSPIILMIKQLRPKQWLKNVLIFAALIFSLRSANLEMMMLSIYGFIFFSLVASAVYIFNDYIDREADRNHPTKRFRPMASGALNPLFALSVGSILLIFSIVSGFMINSPYGLLLCLYFIINISYALSLKNVVIIDIMCIASGFVLRAIGGGLVIGVKLTPWFLMCTMLLSLFLAITKRRQEIVNIESNGSTRKVLQFYNKEMLDQMNTIVTSSTIMCYALFTFTSGRTIQLMWTIPFVIFGIFRYLYLIHIKGKGESPDRVMLEDKPLLISIALYAVSVVLILTYFE
jgi:4-hydroxybenzoate polyprenyltransferase